MSKLISLTFLQKVLLTGSSSCMAFFKPHRGDMICTFGELTATGALKNLSRKMSFDKIGSEILREKPILHSSLMKNCTSFEDLKNLDKNSFGYHYYKFMTFNNLNMNDREPVQFIADPNLAYVMLRYRQIHDFIHTITGQPTNLIGEITVKLIEAYQTKLPMCLLGALFSPTRLGSKHFEFYIKESLPWIIETFEKSPLFINIYFEKEWKTPIEDLRQRLGISHLINTPFIGNKSSL